MQEQELIAVRVKDGIFAGNVTAAEDREFLGMNKITHIINCAGGEVADYFVGDPELKYLSFPWKDTGSVCTTVLFDLADENIKKTIAFVDEAVSGGNCVLIHSVYGVSRCAALIAAFFIVKYGWKLENALSFLEMAHPDVSIKPHFLRQLRTFAKKHQVEHDVFDKAVNDSEFGLDNDQWMLRNTLLNGLAFEEQQANELYKQCSQKIDVGSRRGKKKAAHISFVDTNKGTDVSSLTTTPVINVMPVHHMDPNAKTPGFTGSQGPVALRSGRTSPSILSRSTSPCAHRLESDPKTNPKGRQELALIPGAANPPVETKQITGSSAKPSAERNPSLNTIPVSIRPAAKEGSEEKPSADYARLAPPVHRSQFTLKSGNKYRNGSPLPIQGKKSTIKKRKASPATRSSSAGPKSPRGSNASGAPEPKKTIQRSAPSSYKGIAPSRTIKADTSSTASADGRAPATVTRPRSASARSGSAKAKDRTSSPGAKKSKSRTGSPAAEPRTSKPTTTKLTKSGSTSSLNSADTNNSPSRRTVTSTPNAPSTVSRQLPAVISSRRKTT